MPAVASDRLVRVRAATVDERSSPARQCCFRQDRPASSVSPGFTRGSSLHQGHEARQAVDAANAVGKAGCGSAVSNVENKLSKATEHDVPRNMTERMRTRVSWSAAADQRATSAADVVIRHGASGQARDGHWRGRRAASGLRRREPAEENSGAGVVDNTRRRTGQIPNAQGAEISVHCIASNDALAAETKFTWGLNWL